MRNTNVLEGMKCPNCFSTGPFQIVGKTLFTVTDEGTGDHSHVEWDDDSVCLCESCKFDGTVKDFLERQGKYDHVFTLSFSVITDHAGTEEDPVPALELKASIERRLRQLNRYHPTSRFNQEHYGNACEGPNDTMDLKEKCLEPPPDVP